VTNRSLEETYKGHLIVVEAKHLAEDSWTYTVDIRLPDGNWLPTISDDDHTYEGATIALTSGLSDGKEQVDRP